MRYVIIGSGVAGVSAAEVIRMKDIQGEIIMFNTDIHGFYSKPGLAYTISNEIPDKQIFTPLQRNWLKENVSYFQGNVSRIFPLQQQVEVNNSRQIDYDLLLIATGSQAAQLNVVGETLSGVVKLDDYEDSLKLKKFARKAHSAVVVGGGITALELTEGLTAQRVKVHYLLRGDRFWQSVLDEDESRIIESKLIDEGVTIHHNSGIKEILGKKGMVESVVTQKGERIRCNLVGAAVGIKPRTSLAIEAGLAVERGILVNEYMETSHPGIFAAGDVAQVFDPLSGKYLLDSLWNPAREQGRLAGINMAGGKQAYKKEIAYNVTRLAGVTTTIIGMLGGNRTDDDLLDIARGDSEVFQQPPNAIAMRSGSDVNQIRMMVGEKTLVGAIVMGDQTLSRPIKELILNQVEICPIHDLLLQKDVLLAELVMNFWMDWKKNEGSIQK